MKKIKLSKEDKAQLLERFNIANVETTENKREINIDCICMNYDYGCFGCPFGRKHGCLAFVNQYFGCWGTEIIGRRGIFWGVDDDEKSLKFIAAVRKWLNSLP